MLVGKTKGLILGLWKVNTKQGSHISTRTDQAKHVVENGCHLAQVAP